MKIRIKIIGIVMMITILLAVVIYTISYSIMLNEFYKLEKEDVSKNVERTLNALSKEIKEVAQSSQDWGKWDDTYYYIENRNKDYEISNFNIESFEVLDLNEFVYTDLEGNIVYSKKFDHINGIESNLSEEDIFIYKKLSNFNKSIYSGLMYKNNELLIFSKSPILMGSRPSKSNGELYFSRNFDENHINKLEETTQMEISIYQLENYSYLGEKSLITSNNLTKEIFIHQVNNSYIIGYTILKDFEDKPISVIEITLPRRIIWAGKESLNYLLIFIICFSLIFGISLFIILEKVVISKIYNLSEEVKKVSESTSQKKKVSEKGDNEITNLAHSINDMLSDLDASEKEIKLNSKELEKEKSNLKNKTNELNKYVVELERTRTATVNMLEDLKETNEHLKDMDKIKSNFLNIVSHELKTPLTAIFAYLDILKDMEKNLTDDQKKGFDAIKRNSDQLKGIINNILEISRIEAGKFELIITKINPIEKIRNTLQNLKPLVERKGLKFQMEVDKNLTKMETDEQRFEEIMNNLISNAIKFTEKGSITISAKKKDKFAEFSIADTGVGVPEDKISQLFQKFYQVDASISRKFGGTGLGLSITKQLIELQGGRIWVKSVLGKGTTFFFTLPIKQNKKEETNGS